MSTFRSLPPPSMATVPPPPPPAAPVPPGYSGYPGYAPAAPYTVMQQPVAFRSYRSPSACTKGTLMIDDHQPGSVVFSGEFYPPAAVRSFAVGQRLLTLVALAAFVGMAVSSPETGEPTPAAWVLSWLLLVGAAVAMTVWKFVLRSKAQPATIVVPTASLERLRVSPNWNNLWWMLLIGLFSLIVVFSGRKLLRVDFAAQVEGYPDTVHLVVRELRRGDADALAARLRVWGAR